MEIKTLLANSLYQLLRPVARIAMRHGLTTRDFHDIAKKAFVDVAREAYGIGGRPTNKSRVAALTGLTRAEVARLVDLNGEGSDERLGGRHPLNRVVTHWLRGADWTDADGQPRELLVEGESGSFSALVRAVGCDLPWQTLLRELQQIGAPTSYNHQKLKLGYGEACCSVLKFLLDQARGAVRRGAVRRGAARLQCNSNAIQ